MADRKTFKSLAKARLKSAQILFALGDYDAATYMTGYVVEFALKAAVCKTLKLSSYPDTGVSYYTVFRTHNFDQLLVLSGLSEEIDLSKNPGLFQSWSDLTKDWSPEIRYMDVGTFSKASVEIKLKALVDPSVGFLTWIRKGKKW